MAVSHQRHFLARQAEVIAGKIQAPLAEVASNQRGVRRRGARVLARRIFACLAWTGEYNKAILVSSYS